MEHGIGRSIALRHDHKTKRDVNRLTGPSLGLCGLVMVQPIPYVSWCVRGTGLTSGLNPGGRSNWVTAVPLKVWFVSGSVPTHPKNSTTLTAPPCHFSFVCCTQAGYRRPSFLRVLVDFNSKGPPLNAKREVELGSLP